MATPSPLNFNQRGKAASPRGFTTAEDYASHHAALNSGPTGMHEKNTIQSGPHKGKTPDQVYAHYLDAGMALGIPRRSVDGSTNGRLLLGQAPGQAPAPGSSPVAPVSPRAASPVSPAPAASPAAPAAPMAAAPRPASKPKSFDGMSATQFGSQAAARQGRGNSFTGYQQFSYADPFQSAPSGTPAAQVAASPSSVGPAQKALADFTAANPNVKTQAEIDQMQQTFQDNRDNLATIQAQKAIAAGPPRAVSPGSPPLANAAGQTGNLLTKLTQPKPSLAPLLSSPTTPPLRAGVAATPPASLSSRSKSAITAAVAASPKPQPIPDEYYRSLPMEGVKGAANLAKGAFNAVSHVGEKIAEQFDTSFIHTPPPLLARKPAPVGTGPFVSLPPGMGARAEGGPVQGGKPYLVGERGPEIVVPAQNGTVIPNKAISPSRLGRDKAMAYPPAGYPDQGLAPAADQGLAPAAGQVRRRPMATNNDWRSPTRPVKASRPSLLASR